MLRTQLGWLPEHPVRFPCGACKITIAGTVYLDQTRGQARLEFANASEIYQETPQFYLEASGELLTKKLEPFGYSDPNVPLIPPFFETFWAMDENRLVEFKTKVIQFLAAKDAWPEVKRTYELWWSKNWELLASELNRWGQLEHLGTDNPLLLCQGTRYRCLSYLSPVLADDFDERYPRLFQQVTELGQGNAKGFRSLLDYFSSGERINAFEHSFVRRTEDLRTAFPYLIPAFGLRFYREAPDLDARGVTTTAFGDVKDFFSQCFETGVELLELIVAFNNLAQRGDFMKMASGRKDIKTLADFLAKPKGVRSTYLTGNEPFDWLMPAGLNNQLRNAIAHDAYREDLAQQLVTYYPSGNLKSGPEATIRIVDFMTECINVYDAIFMTTELAYKCRQIELMRAGHKPANIIRMP